MRLATTNRASARVVSNEFERGEKAFPTIEASIDEELTLSAAASESRSRDASDEEFQVLVHLLGHATS